MHFNETSLQDIEASNGSLMAFVHAMEMGKDFRKQVLKEHSIDLDTQEWIPLSDSLQAFNYVAQTLGEKSLYIIGKAITRNAPFPPMEGLEQALASIDIAYHMNHRKGGQVMYDPRTLLKTEGIGHYKLTTFDRQEKRATMVCDNPYPSEFDRGIIAEITRKFKPTVLPERVELDKEKETRKEGGESCTYHIFWGEES